MIWLGLRLPPKAPKRLVGGIAYEYSDQLAWPEPDLLVMEIEKSHRLYESHHQLINQLIPRLLAITPQLLIGIAPNPTAAGLLSQQSVQCWNPTKLEQTLSTWPIHQLPIENHQKQSIERCGIRTLGQLIQQPKDQRIRRFGVSLDHYIDQLYGQRVTVLDHWQPQSTFYRRTDLTHSIEHTQRLMRHIEPHLDALDQWLSLRDQALNSLHLYFKHEHHPSNPVADKRITIGLSTPSFSHAHIKTLIELKMESMVIQRPITTIIMRCDSTQQYQPPQMDLLNGQHRSTSWPELIDRLQNRLGPKALKSISTHPSHRPEEAWQWSPPHRTQTVQDSRQRPMWLLPKPLQCHPRQLVLKKGPERIETDWWLNQPCQRDYWVAIEPSGRTLWVFHEHKPRMGWFIHGIFESDP